MSQEVAESSKNEHEMTMKYWYLTGDNVNDLVVHGAVHGNPKFTDGTRIHTSTIMEFHHAGEEIVFVTRNSVYHCAYRDASFARTPPEVQAIFPNFNALREKYEQEFSIPGEISGNAAMLVFDAEASGGFVAAVIQENGREWVVHEPYIHLGMFQDSCLIHGNFRADFRADYRWFPLYHCAKMYGWEPEYTTIVRNVGSTKWTIDVSEKEYVIPPGDRITFFPERNDEVES